MEGSSSTTRMERLAATIRKTSPRRIQSTGSGKIDSPVSRYPGDRGTVNALWERQQANSRNSLWGGVPRAYSWRMVRAVPEDGIGRARRGFTLIEMIVVIVIVGILSVLAYSGWGRVMYMVQAKGAADEVRNAILLARADAMTRRHYSGVVLDTAGHRYLRFVDSTLGDLHNGDYDQGETVLQNWTPLPSHLVFQSASSSTTSDPVPRVCRSAAAPTTTIPSTGSTYPIVFRPDGRSVQAFTTKFFATSFPDDIFSVDVLPATGLVTVRH